MNIALAAALLLASPQAAAPEVEVATGDWSAIPWMTNRSVSIIGEEALESIHRSFARGECTLAGQSKKRLDLKLPFLVEFGEAGEVKRLVLRKIGCPSVERMLASVVLEQVRTGEYRPPRGEGRGWYRSEVHLNSS